MDGFCACCGEACRQVPVDFGIGWTAFGSSWHNDVQIVLVSECCEADVTPTQVSHDQHEEHCCG